jgi:hypothetical protein
MDWDHATRRHPCLTAEGSWKVAYEGRDEALRVVHTMQSTAGYGSLHEYLCPCCNRWHVGHASLQFPGTRKGLQRLKGQARLRRYKRRTRVLRFRA